MANIFQDNNIIYKYNRNKDNSIVLPKIFLRTRTLKKIGIISPVFDLKIVTNFNESNTCSFTIYKNNNGIEKPIFNRIKNLSIIEIEGFGLFEINVKTIDDNVTYKNISGTSLQESELGQYDCTLEINTESDIERPDYDNNYPTLFYRDLSLATSDNEREKMCQSSLLHRILTYAPTYNIGHVDGSLKGINREFSCSDSNVYDFLQDIAEEVGCIFIFNPNSREINAYDLEDHCLKCGGRHIINGVCQNCKEEGIVEHGYGLDTSIYVDTKTIAESIEDSVDVGNVKNCFKLVAGDDEITNRIGQRLIGNSNYLWTFSDDQIQEFSEALREKWINYADYVNIFQSEFDSLWDSYNENLDKISDYQYGMMPVSEQTIGDNPTQTCQDIFTDIQTNIPYYVIGAKNAVKSTVQSNILKYCNYICRQGYTVEYQKDTSSQPIVNVETTRIDNMDVITKFSAKLYIYVPSCKDENDNDKYYYKSDTWTINVLPGYDKIDSDNSEVFTHNYYLYLKQMIDLKMAKSDITFNPKYDTDYDDKTAHPDDPYYYKNLFREYAIERLNSFLAAYDACVVILSELDSDLATNELQRSYNYLIDDKGTVSTKTMYETLIEKFTAFSSFIRDILAEYETIVKDLESENEEISNDITEINTKCNIKNYLGESLYNELISFKREQTYENQNFTSDVVDEATLMSNVEEFILRAKEEITKSCQFQHSVPISMANLLTLTDFEKVFNVFALGNYMRTRINGELVKLRIISIPFDFENIEKCEVTFSDALVGNQKLKDLQKKNQKAASMATSFDYVQKQSTQNDKKISTFSQIFNEGLDATKTMIMSADDVTTVMDGHGILTRRMNMDTGEYESEQMRITNGTMGFTDDNWNTIKTAFGKFWWNGSYRYGLIGESIIGQILAGENLIIANNDNSVIIDGDGITLDGGKITWKTKLPQSSVEGLNDTFDTFVKATTYDAKVAELQSQIDGNITTWFYDYLPSSNKEPEINWKTDTAKIAHEGDLFYCTDSANAHAYRYVYNDTIKQHEWLLIEDTDVTKALADAAKAQDTADNKRRVFVTTPTTPYDVGDLWTQGSNGDILKCKTARSSGSYNSNDWEIASKYTDDTNALIALEKAQKGIEDAANALTSAKKYADGLSLNYDAVGSANAVKSYVDGDFKTSMETAYQKYSDTAVSNFDKAVAEYLQVPGATTIVGGNHVISPYIEGGYLNITNGNKQVIVDPSNQTKTGYIFAVKNGTEFTVGIKADGTTNVKAGIVATSLDLSNCSNKVSTDYISGLSKVATSGNYGDLGNRPDLTVYAKSGDLEAYLKTNDLSAKLNGLNVAYNGDVITTQTVDSSTGLITTTNKYKDSSGVSHEYTTYTYKDSDYVLLNRTNQWGSGDTLVKIEKDGLLTAKNALIYGTIYATDGEFGGELKAATGSFTGSINVNNKFKVDSEGNVTLPSGTKLSWSDVTGTDNIATKSYVTSQGYETATSIKNTVITKDYIETLNIKAGSVAAENITGTTISGKTISGGTITQDNGYYSVTLNDGYLKVGNVAIFNGLLNYNSSKTKYANAINFGCDKFTGEVGMRWQDDTVRLIGKPSKLWLGESSYPIGQIYMSGEITGNWKDSSDSLKITGCSSASIGAISNCTSLSMSSGSLTGCSSASIGTISDCTIATITTLKSNVITPIISSSSGSGTIGSLSSPYYALHVKTAYYDNQQALSDRRMKKDIMPLSSKFAVDFLNAQRVMTYTYTYEEDAPTRYGMVAQDVEEALLNMGLTQDDFVGLHTPNDENKYYGLDYTTFIPLLISYCQSLYKDLSICKQEIKSLQNSLSKFCEVDK